MLDERYKIDELAAQAGGYFALPTEENMAYTELLFDICQQFGMWKPHNLLTLFCQQV